MLRAIRQEPWVGWHAGKSKLLTLPELQHSRRSLGPQACRVGGDLEPRLPPDLSCGHMRTFKSLCEGLQQVQIPRCSTQSVLSAIDELTAAVTYAGSKR